MEIVSLNSLLESQQLKVKWLWSNLQLKHEDEIESKDREFEASKTWLLETLMLKSMEELSISSYDSNESFFDHREYIST